MEKITANEFDLTVAHGITLVDFFTNHCGPCKQMEGVLDQLDTSMPSVNIVSIDAEENVDLVSAHGITSVPTFELWSDGVKKGTRVGFVGLKGMQDWIEGQL